MAKSSSSPKKKKPTWKRVLFWILIALLAIILCLFMTAFAVYQYAMDKINRPDPTETYISEADWIRQQQAEETDTTYEVVDPDTVELPPAEATINQSEETVNILLVGQDRRPGEGRARSDSMILCSFNPKNGTLQMISFLRDLYVSIPDRMDNRLNAAYAMGGFEMLDATLTQNFGVRIDANIEVDFSGFEKIIDILGGVDVSLTQAEADWLNRGGYSLMAGMNHMDGELALKYARIRYLDSDFGRTGRQRNVMTSIFNSVRNVDLATAKALVDEFLPLVTTDMTNTQILNYVTTLLPMLPKAEINSLCIPADDAFRYASIRGMSVIVADMKAAQDLLADLLGE